MRIELTIKDLVKKNKTLNEDKEKVVVVNSELQLKIIGIEEEKKKLLEEYKSVKESYEKFQEADSEFRKSAKDDKTMKNQLKVELAKAQSDYQSLEVRLSTVEQEAGLLRGSVAQLEKVNAEKTEQEAELRKVLEEKDNHLNKANKTIDELKQQLDSMKQNMNLTAEEWKKKYDEKESEIKEAQARLAELSMSIAKENKSALKEKITVLENENINLLGIKSKLEEQIKDKDILYSNLKEELTSHKKHPNVVQNNEYMLDIKEKTSINTIYGRYNEAIRMFKEYVRKYQEEKMRAHCLEKQLHAVISTVESKAPLIEAQRIAYEELSAAYVQKVKLYQQQQKELEKAKLELSKIELPSDSNILHTKMGELKLENKKLKEEIKELREAKDNLKRWYEEELKKQEEGNKQVLNKLETLKSTASTSDKLYEQFSAHSVELKKTIAKLSESEIVNASVNKEKYTIPKAEASTNKQSVKLSEQLLLEQIELWKEKANYHVSWVEELKKQIQNTTEANKAHIKLIKDAEQKKAEVEITKAQEEAKRTQTKLLQCKAELKITQENEKRYKEQNDKLRNEIESLNNTFTSVKTKLIESALLQYKLVKESLEKQNSISEVQVSKEIPNEDAMLLRVSNQSLQAVNENLTAQLAEMKSKCIELEKALQIIEESTGIILQPTESKEDLLKERINRIVLVIEKAKEDKPKEVEDVQSLKDKIQGDEKEIHKLKELIAKQQQDYSTIIGSNEQIIEYLQNQLISFKDSAMKYIESMKQEKDKEIESLKQSEAASKENAYKRVNELTNTIEQLKQEILLKEQNIAKMEKRMKVEKEAYEKTKSEMKKLIKELQNKANAPPTEALKGGTNTEEDLKVTINKLKAEIETLKEQLATEDLATLRKENEELSKQLEALPEKEEEIMAYKCKISKLKDEVLIMAETINKKEDIKESNHAESIKKLAAIGWKGKYIIEKKNQIIEKLKNERLKDQCSLPIKRKKIQ